MVKRFIHSISSIFVILFLFVSCTTTSLYSDYDPIKSVYKEVLNLQYQKPRYNQNTLLGSDKEIEHKLKKNGERSVTVYDVVVLTNSAYFMQDSIYLILDTNYYKIHVKVMDEVYNPYIEQITKDICTIDSVKMKVVVDYKQYKNVFLKTKYSFTERMIKDILQTDRLWFKYYVGPYDFTLKTTKNDLYKLKAILNTKEKKLKIP